MKQGENYEKIGARGLSIPTESTMGHVKKRSRSIADKSSLRRVETAP
jgi:hypothetical protein